MHGGYGIAFDGAGSWSFANEFARNVIIFGDDNSSSSHADNRKNNFLVLGEGPTEDINDSMGPEERTFSINFSKTKTKFCLSLHYNGGNSYLFVNGKEIYEFNTDNKNVNCPTQFYLGTISKKIEYFESEEVSYKGNFYDFSVDYDANDKSEILNIHKYLMDLLQLNKCY